MAQHESNPLLLARNWFWATTIYAVLWVIGAFLIMS